MRVRQIVGVQGQVQAAAAESGPSREIVDDWQSGKGGVEDRVVVVLYGQDRFLGGRVLEVETCVGRAAGPFGKVIFRRCRECPGRTEQRIALGGDWADGSNAGSGAPESIVFKGAGARGLR